jgi:signal transduction histidine kinase
MNKLAPAEPQSRAARFSIRGKLLGVSILVGLVAAAIGIGGLQRMNLLHQRLTQTVDYSSEKVKLTALLKQDFVSVTRAEKNLMLARSDQEMDRYAETIDKSLDGMRKIQDRLRTLADAEDRRQLEAFENKWDEWQKNHHDVRNFAQLNSDLRARKLSLGQGRESFERFESALTAIFESVARNSDHAPDAAATPEQRAAQRRKMDAVARLLRGAASIQRAEKQLILAASEEELARNDDAFEPLQTDLEAQFETLQKLDDDADKPPLADARRAFKEYVRTLVEIRSFVGQKGNFFVRHFAYEIGGPIAAECEQRLNEIIAKNEKDLRDYRVESQATYINARNTLVAFSAVGIAISVAVTFVTGQQIARNLGRLTNYARLVQSTGDLSQRVPRGSKDEVGMLAEAFDHMRESLHRQTSELAALNTALDQKNQEMEQFVYTVSHDLSSPLVSCKGLIGLMREDVAEENYSEVISSAEKLDQAVDQLRLVIDDLLMLSRIGRKSLELVQVDMDSLVRGLHEELADRLAQAGAELRIESPLPAVIADAKDVRRVFENLLVNAIKYACDGPQRVITIGAVASGSEVRYFVRDTGPGIEPEYQEKIFGWFQRLDTEKPGTGLGLASVAKVMQMHGGRAWVESVPGEGATFWVAYPVFRLGKAVFRIGKAVKA